MQLRWLIFSLTLFSRIALCGDSASGFILYAADLSQSFNAYTLTPQDRVWGSQLAKKFNYGAKIVYFVRTPLVLLVSGTPVQNQIYQDVNDPERFYILAGDTMVTMGKDHPYSPGVGGFSMHANSAKTFSLVSTAIPAACRFFGARRLARGM